MSNDRAQAISAPAPRQPVPVDFVPTLLGERVVLHATDGGHHYGFRAWSEIYDYENRGRIWPSFDVISEQDYWAWRLTGQQPSRIIIWRAITAWVD